MRRIATVILTAATVAAALPLAVQPAAAAPARWTGPLYCTPAAACRIAVPSRWQRPLPVDPARLRWLSR